MMKFRCHLKNIALKTSFGGTQKNRLKSPGLEQVWRHRNGGNSLIGRKILWDLEKCSQKLQKSEKMEKGEKNSETLGEKTPLGNESV